MIKIKKVDGAESVHKVEKQKVTKSKKHVDDPITNYDKLHIMVIAVVAVLIIVNQVQIQSVTSLLGVGHIGMSGGDGHASGERSKSIAAPSQIDLSEVDVSHIQSTAQGINALFPVDGIETTEDAISVMVPTGTPAYGEEMGVTYDDPVTGLGKLAKAYPALNQQIKQNPEQWERYLSLAAEPRGVSCEFCCGVGPVGVTKDGRSRCGCQHHPAVLSLTQWMIMNTDYTDAEILHEVYKWKTLFFPKNMVGLATQIAGGDASVLEDLPGMVGGC